MIDPATGEECPRGVPGELLFRGVTRFIEYYRDPATTASVIDDEGWAHTGDLVRQEEDDTVAFMSRLKDMLKVGGENASAAEIEGYLITHPGVAMAAVVAAPDARYGEVPAAFVQKAAGSDVTEEELIEYCIGQHRDVQGAALRPLRRRVPGGGQREDPEVRAARADRGRAPRARHHRGAEAGQPALSRALLGRLSRRSRT